MADNQITYGLHCNSEELENFITHILNTNNTLESKGKRKTPLCIWGTHGIGKTETVENFAKKNGYKWVYIAPAQFEEMGDLLGMPRTTTDGKKSFTEFSPPSWVPTEEEKGILLIDDVNRADDRILRGIMQLLQNYELVSWKLPKKWHIILTANPDGGDYSVTPMDFAMITRMIHTTLNFDVKTWAKWAEENNIDGRGIHFVLTNPELVAGERTTPRTLVQFFENIAHIENLKENISLVKMLADGCLDTNTADAFVAYVNQDLSKLISPEEILFSQNFEEDVYNRIKDFFEQSTKRADILSVMCTRLVNFLNNYQEKFTKQSLENLKKFLKIDFFPNDIRLVTAQQLAQVQNKVVRDEIFKDGELAFLFVGNL